MSKEYAINIYKTLKREIPKLNASVFKQALIECRDYPNKHVVENFITILSDKIYELLGKDAPLRIYQLYPNLEGRVYTKHKEKPSKEELLRRKLNKQKVQKEYQSSPEYKKKMSAYNKAYKSRQGYSLKAKKYHANYIIKKEKE